RWDTNRDGRIDLAEFRVHLRTQAQEKIDKEARKLKVTDQGTRGAVVVEDVDEDRPVVYRAGRLPKELPPWFAQFDLNRDGQVSLFEWLRAGRPAREFQAMDRNDDGLLTAEEV